MRRRGFYTSAYSVFSPCRKLSLWQQDLSLSVGFCHVIIHLLQTAISRQEGQFSPWRALVFKNMGYGTPLPAMSTCVALANFLSQKHALCFSIPARATFVARATSPFFLLFMFLSLVHVLITLFLHN